MFADRITMSEGQETITDIQAGFQKSQIELLEMKKTITVIRNSGYMPA